MVGSRIKLRSSRETAMAAGAVSAAVSFMMAPPGPLGFFQSRTWLGPSAVLGAFAPNFMISGRTFEPLARSFEIAAFKRG